MRRLLEASQPMVALLWSRETAGEILDSPERRAALDARLRAHLARIADPGLRAHWEAEIRARRTALFAPPPRSAHAAARKASFSRSAAAAQSPPTAGARRSLIARHDEPEARIRESAILAGCLNHPSLAASLEERLGRVNFICRDLAEIRDALLSVLAESLHEPQNSESLVSAIRARLGFDPLDKLMAVGQVAANWSLGPKASPDAALRVIDEVLTRHAILIDRGEETHDAMAAMARQVGESVTMRFRQLTDAGYEADTQPLAKDKGTEEAEHQRFVEVFQKVEAQQAAKKPRRR
jgi:DNA primase